MPLQVIAFASPFFSHLSVECWYRAAVLPAFDSDRLLPYDSCQCLFDARSTPLVGFLYALPSFLLSSRICFVLTAEPFPPHFIRNQLSNILATKVIKAA